MWAHARERLHGTAPDRGGARAAPRGRAHRFEDFGRVDHVVERPVLLGVPSAHLLPVCSQEALRVEESRQPEGVGPVALQPVHELLIAREDVHPPQADVGHDQLRDVLPESGHARHEERVEHLRQLCRHDDRACGRTGAHAR